jgi:hypothetical protein
MSTDELFRLEALGIIFYVADPDTGTNLNV